MNALKKVTTEIIKPVTCIIGGSKISTKIGIIKNLIPKFDNIIIVGGMANNVLCYKGNLIGKSIKEDNCDPIIEDIFKTAETNTCSIIYPEDVMVGKSMEDKAQAKELNQITDNDFKEAGAEILSDASSVFNSSDMILKVNSPTDDELAMIKDGSSYISFFQTMKETSKVTALKDKKVTAFSMHLIPRTTLAQKMDALSSMANVAGSRAVIEAAHLFGRFFGG